MIGPLVICGVVLRTSNLWKLSQRGVRDSKKLTASKREKLNREIQLLAEGYELIIISPQVIDREGMNDLELKGIVKLINKFLPEQVFLDAPTRNCLSFERKIRELLLAELKVKLVVENFADENYPIVGAASILAKVERDRRISELEREYGNLGSGYPSDEKTIRFLKKYLNQHGCFPPIARKKWKTLARIKKEEERCHKSHRYINS